MFTTVQTKLRPIKIAFLVQVNDPKAILNAIKINSSLWGGSYNPIIPVFYRKPKIWKDHGGWGHTSSTILSGYLDAFNPDFVVQLGKCAEKKLDIGNYKRIAANEIWDKVSEDGTPSYGVGIFELLDNFYQKELKFIRKKPITFCEFQSRKHHLFFAAVFGSLPQPIEKLFAKDWRSHLEAKQVNIDLSSYSDYFRKNFTFFRRLTLQAIEDRRSGACMFFMDPDNSQDIIDYWNLRAIGWTVFPIPKQETYGDSLKEKALDFINDNTGIHRYGKFYIRATILKSRSLEKLEVNDFINSLDIQDDGNTQGKERIVFQHWYPRIWDEWARSKDHARCIEIESKSKTFDFNDDREHLNIRILDPDFISRFGGHGTPRFANVVELRMYREDDIYAEVIPDAGKEATAALGGLGIDEWRFTKKESVYLSKHANWSMSISIPKAEDLFKGWLRDHGLACELSPPGRIAKQMILALGGLRGIQTLSYEKVIELLREMEDGKYFTSDNFFGKIAQISQMSRGGRSTPKDLLEHYIKKRMFKMGAVLQCPTCLHRNWYPLDNLNYELQCFNCHDSFKVPTHDPDEIKWSYKAFGPFSLSGAAEGAYSILLTLRFFSSILDFPTTPIMSFLTEIEERNREIDLGILFKERKMDPDGEVGVAFVEAKTAGDFKKNDIEKMKRMASTFPGSVLVFATMKDKLSAAEKKLLIPLVNSCRRYWKNDKPYNPVLILTKNELFAQMSLDYTWKNLGGEYKEFGDKNFYTDKLLHVCDATQQLYLAMNPWQDEIREKFEKKRKNRSSNSDG